MTAQQYGLGRGLSSLIPQNKKNSEKKDTLGKVIEAQSLEQDSPFEQSQAQGGSSGAVSAKNTDVSVSAVSVQEVPVDDIHANPHQPRGEFNEEKLEELSASIKEKGILQPLTVTQAENGYELIAGERRLRASKMAGLKTVPVIVKEYEDQDKLEMAVVENIQRHDLNPLEEARAYRKMSEEFSLSQGDVAKKMGKSRSSVANTLRLLTLPVEMQKAIEKEQITEGHAKALLALDNPEKQRALFELILQNGLTVRQAEEKARETLGTQVRSHARSIAPQDPQLKAVEDELNEKLGTKVQIKKQGSGAEVRIQCYSREDLIKLVNRMG